MLIFWQIAAFLGLVALTVAWGNWVWDSHRTLNAPTSLGEVSVLGVETDQRDASSRALALGIAATVTEHYRRVDFINQASRTAGEFLIAARGAAPEPLLLQSGGDGDRLDIAVEFAGAKLDSKGLTALFQRRRPPRGALAVSISLSKGATDADWTAFASASFPENSAYGFQTESDGTLTDIARTVGMRFVQAHYAAGDPFFAAISGGDFAKLWDVRREAAQMALRSASGDTEDTAALRNEAREAYQRIEHLLKRYRRREDLQRLGAYLAQLSDELDLARDHAVAARDAAAQDGDRKAMEELLSALKVEIENRKSQSIAATTDTTTNAAATTVETVLDRLRESNADTLAAAGIEALAARLPARRTPRIGMVTGIPPDPWFDTVRIVGSTGAGDSDTVLGPHAARLLSLYQSIAPDTELYVRPVGGQGTGGISFEAIDAALADLAALDLDAIFTDFGVSARSFSGEDGTERWKSATERNLAQMAGFGGLAIFAAGNDNVSLPALDPPQGAPAYVIVGSTAPKGTPFSNYGPGVDYKLPGQVTTTTGDGRFAPQTGTSMSATLFVAAIARLAASMDTAPGGEALKSALSATATDGREGRRPDFVKAASRLVDGQDG